MKFNSFSFNSVFTIFAVQDYSANQKSNHVHELKKRGFVGPFLTRLLINVPVQRMEGLFST